MAQNTKIDDITSKKIYEHVRSLEFRKALFYDVMSDIKEKSAYKRLKTMIKDQISKEVDAWPSIPVNPSEMECRKKHIAELSITAFTVDAIIPTMVYSCLQSNISNIAKDICKQVSEEMNEKVLSAEDSSETTCSSVNKNTTKTVLNGESPKNPVTKRGRGRPRKTSTVPDKVDSDTESVISVGNLSLPSVSSVHTSDLTSYDDEISLSSEDEGDSSMKKRKLPVNAIQEMCKNGRISAWCAENLKSHTERTKGGKSSEPAKNMKKETKVTPDNVSSSTASLKESSPPKTLPQRVRKPNSRYSSDSIYCPIAEKRKKMKQNAGSDEKTVESESSSHKGSPKRTRENEERKSADKIQEISYIFAKKSDVSPVTPSQRKSDFFKPHTAVHSLTSRKTAPVTLYSTVAKSIK